MISQKELQQLSDINTIEKIYEELMLNGLDAIPSQNQKLFSKLCHDLVQQYVAWNDYIHSNNIMQLFKNIAFKTQSSPKPGWFIRYEIIIYGRRTPLYFIDNPKILFDKITAICASKKDNQTEKLSAAIVSLFNYYKHNFLSEQADYGDKELFKKHFKDIFAKEYKAIDKTHFPADIFSVFDAFVDYVNDPQKFIEPSITTTEFELWDEDEFVIPKVENDKQENEITKRKEKENVPPKTEFKKVDVAELPTQKLGSLKGKLIRFIGALNKSSIKNKLQWLSKQYDFEVEIFDDYNKFPNMDFTKMRYSNRISGIIAGPIPHKTKGCGNYSSVIEMMQSEPGYPPLVKCYAGNKLKITATSLLNALLELNQELAAN